MPSKSSGWYQVGPLRYLSCFTSYVRSSVLWYVTEVHARVRLLFALPCARAQAQFLQCGFGRVLVNNVLDTDVLWACRPKGCECIAHGRLKLYGLSFAIVFTVKESMVAGGDTENRQVALRGQGEQ